MNHTTKIYMFGLFKEREWISARQQKGTVAFVDDFLGSPLAYSELDGTFRRGHEELYKSQRFGIACDGSYDVDSDLLAIYFGRYPPGFYEFYIGRSVLICPHDVVLISSALGVDCVDELIGELSAKRVSE